MHIVLGIRIDVCLSFLFLTYSLKFVFLDLLSDNRVLKVPKGENKQACNLVLETRTQCFVMPYQLGVPLFLQ